eukprot:TRINITY_DN21697_c0_g1_i3.p1 TRINITY_DN21697_c0_g1~~TRINITY_DN21697_c0_g1_i3.p1  ORF type:complete len:350 (-),score=85.91 TRINITY_DN21697_c0_g1_i3:166-1215(-)
MARLVRAPDYQPHVEAPMEPDPIVHDIHARQDDEAKYADGWDRPLCRLQQWVEPGSRFVPEPGRYHLWLNYGCGWSHQVLMLRAIKGLDRVVSVSHTGLGTAGQRGSDRFDSAYSVYNCNNPTYGRTQLTIPFLFDKREKVVVSNDPAQILLMLNTNAWDEWAAPDEKLDLYPQDLRVAIEQMNDIVYPGINDGVYRCWFADSDAAYDKAVARLYEALAAVEETLRSQPYLCGDQMSMADIRAFPHLIRFDTIYWTLVLREPRPPMLKSGDYPAIVRWLQQLHEHPKFRPTCDLALATRFYLGPQLSAAESDALYMEHKMDWMPGLDELVAKRAGEQLDSTRLYKVRKI